MHNRKRSRSRSRSNKSRSRSRSRSAGDGGERKEEEKKEEEKSSSGDKNKNKSDDEMFEEAERSVKRNKVSAHVFFIINLAQKYRGLAMYLIHPLRNCIAFI